MSTKSQKKLFSLFYITLCVVFISFMNTQVYAASVTLNPIADKFIDNGTSVWDVGDQLYIPGHAIHWIGTDTSVPSDDAKSVTKFDLSSIIGTVSGAVFRIHIPAINASPSGSAVFGSTNLGIYQSSDDSWTETDTSIPPHSTVIASDTIVAGHSGTWREYNISSFINTEYAGDKVATIVMKGASPDGNQFAYYCKEDSTYAPQLVITYTNSSPTNINLSANSIAENSTNGTTVGNFSTTDPDSGETFTYSLVAGVGSGDNASFSITGNQLKTNTALDYETKTSYSIRVRVTDSHNNNYERSFTVNVTNVNEAPTNISLSNNSVSENVPLGTTVGTLTATDPDSGATFTYSLAAGAGDADNDSFVIAGSSLRSDTLFDYNTKSSYGIRIRVTDNGGLYYEKSFTINITEVDTTPPTVSALSPADGAGNVAVNADLVITFSENVVKGTEGNITIKKTIDDNTVDEIDVTSANVSVSNKTVTISHKTLAINTGYYVLITPGAFKDTAGNDYAGISNKGTWNFTTMNDTTPPTVTNTALSSGDVLRPDSMLIVEVSDEAGTGINPSSIVVSFGGVTSTGSNVITGGKLYHLIKLTLAHETTGALTVTIEDYAGNSTTATLSNITWENERKGFGFGRLDD
jgi:hypothetical protein